MLNRNSLIFCALLLCGAEGFSQETPPCGNDYGSSADESNIMMQMRYGSISDAENAINQAKNTRGTALGCPQHAYDYADADLSVPPLAEIIEVWDTEHVSALLEYSVTCPRIGRYENNTALGAWYAMQAGYFTDTLLLSEIAFMMYAQQYADWNVSAPEIRNEGVYAYLHVEASDPCYQGGVVGSSVEEVCDALPEYCVTYSKGQFADYSFLVSGQDDANSWFDGGLAYDHGWVGVQMIEASLNVPYFESKQLFRNSVELAGQYAINEHCVKNHNYTAKLIWLLAELYAWTGEAAYKYALNYKLDKNLLPGILFDANKDGNVDGTSPPVAFSSLNTAAQLPGRMWDGHNSLPWYHAMNAWALTEAYVAFRDMGDTERAAELKPYVQAMLDNLATEIINQGVVSPDMLGVRDITYALLTGIWKISQYEDEAHLDWELAAWAMWNSGYFNTYSTHSVCVGFFLLVRSVTAYSPLQDRGGFVLETPALLSDAHSIRLYPNPATDQVFIENIQGAVEVHLYSQTGQILRSFMANGGTTEISLDGYPTGIYFLRISDKCYKVFIAD